MKKFIFKFLFYKCFINIGYDIINYLADKSETFPIDEYDDQEELAEHIEEMLIERIK